MRGVAFSTESAREVVQVNGPNHSPSKAVLQQPFSLCETVRGDRGVSLHECRERLQQHGRKGGDLGGEGMGAWLSCSDFGRLMGIAVHKERF